MVPWFHPIFGKVEPWNHGTQVPGYTFWVPWFHGSMVPPKFFRVEPWNLGSRLHIWGSMVPWFHPKIFLAGTMEPWNLGSRLHKKGSMVPWFQGGTMEPWNHGTQMCNMSNISAESAARDNSGGQPVPVAENNNSIRKPIKTSKWNNWKTGWFTCWSV